MTEPVVHRDVYAAERSSHGLDDIDTEIARLALLCQVRILDPGVVERVVRNDESVCGTSNPVGFAKLRGLLALHFGVRESVADAVGQAMACRIEQEVMDRLRDRFPSLAAEWPPAIR